MAQRYWLLKSEPEVFSIEDLERAGKTGWEGVRNYQARNFIRDQMRVGDGVLFYHSNAEPSGVAGLARVASEAEPDPTQFDVKSEYFDAVSRPEAPRWFEVRVAFVERFPQVLPLARLKAEPKLAGLLLLARGQRLSVQPVERRHFEHIVALARGRSAPRRPRG